jgi:hypothetical protein
LISISSANSYFYNDLVISVPPGGQRRTVLLLHFNDTARPMVAEHLRLGFAFGLSISVVSWIVGIGGGAVLLRSRHVHRLSHLNFIRSPALNGALGLGPFKWIVKNTFFRFLNQGIRVGGKRTDLASIRHEMTVAEVNHLVGFLFVAVVALYQGVNVGPVFALTMMIPNVVLNGYPVLLQQENKRRIDRHLTRRVRKHDARP